jgi:anti-sigma factor RsiW
MNELSCNELVELVTAYRDGALDPAEERRVLDHLAGCAGCSTYVDQIAITIRQLSTLPADPLDEQTRQRLLAAFRDAPPDRV